MLKTNNNPTRKSTKRLYRAVHGNKAFNKSEALEMIRLQINQHKTKLALLEEGKSNMRVYDYRTTSGIYAYHLRRWQLFEKWLQKTEMSDPIL